MPKPTEKELKEAELKKVRLKYNNRLLMELQFRGEKPWMPYFVDMALNGENPTANSWTFTVTPYDLVLFPELTHTNRVELSYDPDLDLYTMETYG